MRVRSGKRWDRDLGQGFAQTSAFASLNLHGLRTRLDKKAVLESAGLDNRHPVRQYKPIIGREDNIAV